MTEDQTVEPQDVAEPAEEVDDHVTEKDAVARAKAEGIEFVDEFYVLKDGEFTPTPEDKPYKTLSAAKKAKKTGYNVVQLRKRKA